MILKKLSLFPETNLSDYKIVPNRVNRALAKLAKPGKKNVLDEVRMGYDFIPSYTIKPDSLVLWTYVSGLTRTKPKQPMVNKRSTLSMSRKSSARMYGVITTLYKCSKSKSIFQKSTGKFYSFKVNFITLTLPARQLHSDREIHKQIFEPFIRRCRILYPGFMYVYKAEVQDNGNLHYHVNTNVFIHYAKLRELWNAACERLGYVSRSASPDPNSTDVKAVKSKTELAKYMSKYMTKNDRYDQVLKRYFRRYGKTFRSAEESCQIPRNYFKHLKRKVDIKLWDCSRALKNVKSTSYGIDSTVSNEVEIIVNKSEMVKADFATIFFGVNYADRELVKLGRLWREMLAGVIAKEKDSLKYIEIE